MRRTEVMPVFARICWKTKSNTTGGVIRLCGWAPMMGTLSLPQIHLGGFGCRCSKAYRKRQRQNQHTPGGRGGGEGGCSPGNWCYLIALGRPLNQWGKKNKINNSLNQVCFTHFCKTKTNPAAALNWNVVLHTKGKEVTESLFWQMMLWMNNCITAVQATLYYSPSESHYLPRNLRSPAPR